MPLTAVGAARWREDPRGGFRSLGDMFSAMRRFRETGGRAYDERLKPLAAAGSDEQGEYSDPHGAFLVPDGLLGVLSVPLGADPMGSVTRVDMPWRRARIAARTDKDHSTTVTGGLNITRTPETVEAVVARGQLEQIYLDAHDGIGLTFATDSVVDGASPLIEEWLAVAYRDAYTDFARTERLFGTGVGEGLGVMNSPALIVVAKEAGQAADTISKENIDSMESRSWDYSRATWIANYNTRSQLKKLVQVVGTAGAAVPYLTCVGDQELLDGRPIFFTDIVKTLGDEGDLILVVWSEYLDAVYKPLELASSMHVRFVQGETAFRAHVRCDFAPWWRVPLSPRYGTLSVSPYVTLEARA